MADVKGDGFEDDIDAICDEAVKTAKIWPAKIDRYRQEWRADVFAAGRGGSAMERIVEIRDMVSRMPRLLPQPARPPMPTEAAEVAAQAANMEPFPSQQTASELIEIPIGRDLFIARQKGGGGHRPPQVPRRAQWDLWRRVDRIELWKAVLLSLDIDPRTEPDHGLTGRPAMTLIYDGLASIQARNRERIHERLIVAQSCLGTELKTGWGGEAVDVIVRLQDFGAFAVHKGMELPEAFPRPLAAAPVVAEANAAPGSSTAGVSISLPHVSKGMAALFDVIRAQWAEYDSKHPPKQTAVAEAIDKVMGWTPKPDGSPSRNATSLAALVKPDSVTAIDKRGRK